MELWDSDQYREYIYSWTNEKKLLKIWNGLFDEKGTLKIINEKEWKQEYVALSDYAEYPEPELEDEVPF